MGTKAQRAAPSSSRLLGPPAKPAAPDPPQRPHPSTPRPTHPPSPTPPTAPHPPTRDGVRVGDELAGGSVPQDGQRAARAGLSHPARPAVVAGGMALLWWWEVARQARAQARLPASSRAPALHSLGPSWRSRRLSPLGLLLRIHIVGHVRQLPLLQQQQRAVRKGACTRRRRKHRQAGLIGRGASCRRQSPPRPPPHTSKQPHPPAPGRGAHMRPAGPRAPRGRRSWGAPARVPPALRVGNVCGGGWVWE